MKLDNQVCSLELAKKLKELGFKQESLFWWVDGLIKVINGRNRTIEPHILSSDKKDELEEREPIVKGYYSAYTSSELGEMLPNKLNIKARATDYECDYTLSISKIDEKSKGWEISYCGGGDSGCLIVVFSSTEADARAKTLIYLKENKLI